MDPMKFCFDEIDQLKKCQIQDRAFYEDYEELKNNIEDYMCALLDEVWAVKQYMH